MMKMDASDRDWLVMLSEAKQLPRRVEMLRFAQHDILDGGQYW